MNKFAPALVGSAVILAAAGVGGQAMGQAKGAYTTAQAARGAATYTANCALCHGESLTGGPGSPPLTGPAFLFTWKAKSVQDLFDYVKANMPPTNAGSLSDPQYADAVAYILQANGSPAGDKELGSDPASQKGLTVGGQ